MKKADVTITMQELRRDPQGFVRQINAGKSVSIIYHSREVANVKSVAPTAPKPTKRDAAYWMDLSDKISSQVKNPPDSNKSIKELYHEMLDEKYNLR